MVRLRRENFWMLMNGYCTRPAELDWTFESAWLGGLCHFFQSGRCCVEDVEQFGV